MHLGGNNEQQQTTPLPQIKQTEQPTTTPSPPSQPSPQPGQQGNNQQQQQQSQDNQGQPPQKDIPSPTTTTTTQQPPVAINPQQFTSSSDTANSQMVQQTEEQLLGQITAQKQQPVVIQTLTHSKQTPQITNDAGTVKPNVVLQQPFIQIRVPQFFNPFPKPVVLNEQPDDRSILNQRPGENTEKYDEPIISDQSTIKSRPDGHIHQRSQYPSPTVTRYVKQVVKPVLNETLKKRKLLLKEKEERLLYPTPPGLTERKHKIHVTEAPLPLIDFDTDKKRSRLLYTHSKYLYYLRVIMYGYSLGGVGVFVK